MLPASLAAKWLPREFVEATRIGGVYTVVAYLLMLVMFACELQSFLKRELSSSMLLDFVQDPQLQINFDIDMYDIECRNLNVIVVDEFREEPIRSFSRDFSLHSLDHRGNHKGIHSTHAGEGEESEEEAEHQRKHQELERLDGRGELDADWASSDDGFKHKAFSHVVEYHDFTLINFFAGWCIHCQQFAPKWREIAEKVNAKKFVDRDGNEREVRSIKMNCVDFKALCRERGIDAFPTIRLYKSDGTFSLFEGDRNEGSILRWIELVVRTKAYGWKKHHEDFEAGCNLKGYVRVPRVPGHLELTAGAGDQNLEPTMTNVSHHIKHLSFTSPQYPVRRMQLNLFPFGNSNYNLLDMKSFCTREFHEQYEHHLRLVSTINSVGATYQFSHYGRTAKLNETVVPQVRFYFDFEPFALSITEERKQWYQFATSSLAILGGVFVMMRLASMVSLTAAGEVMRRASGGSTASRAANGLVT